MKKKEEGRRRKKKKKEEERIKNKLWKLAGVLEFSDNL